MTNTCEALNRSIREPHPEVASAPAAKTDLLLSGVAVDEHARVAIDNEASKLYEASPRAADKRAAQIVRSASVQTADRVPPKSLARDMAFAKLQSRILSAAEAVQAAKLHSEMLPEQQAIMLSAGRPGTGTCLHGHAQVTDRTATECAMEDGHGVTAWRHAGRWSAVNVCSEEGQRWGHVRTVSGNAPPFHPFCCKYGSQKPHRAVQCTL